MQVQDCEIVVEDERFLVVVKPAGLPTVPLAKEPSAHTLLTQLCSAYPEISQNAGVHAHEGLVLHRLDTDTCGLVLVARDIETYHTLQTSQRARSFIKRYIAAVADGEKLDGFPPIPTHEVLKDPLIITSMFRPYGVGRRAVRPVTTDAQKHIKKKSSPVLYTTVVQQCGSNDDGHTLFCCELTKGYRHQVRCHLAWLGQSIIGDTIYGGLAADMLHLAAVELTFKHPQEDYLVHVVWDDAPAWTHKREVTDE